MKGQERMIDRADLWTAGAAALAQLGLNSWKIFYTDEEAETIRDRLPTTDSAWNIRFNVVTSDSRFLTLRLRLTHDQMTDPVTIRESVSAALVNRIRHDHIPRVQ